MDARKNRRTALFGVAVIVCMLGLTAASVPLYNLFCRVTGYGGTTQVAEALPETAAGPPIEVSFNADHEPGLPWSFHPAQRSVEVLPGENRLIFYEATNNADHPIVGRAVYNVTPFKVGAYFAKIACFCFDEQVLQPGERVDMPVSFFVDPAMLTDPDTQDVREITLSYTFFIDAEATAALAAHAAARVDEPSDEPS
ncbi:MAG: cytochrome c oxidase assembly protein [Geminicoccaceae bacterium]